MSRPKALLAALLALAGLPARAGAPLDLDLNKLGAPRASIWLAIPGAPGPTPSAAEAQDLAAEARGRFARLAAELALGWTAGVLQPAATTGLAGYQLDLELTTVGVRREVMGTAGYTPAGASAPAFPRDAWPTQGEPPSALLVTGVHARKALPFSVELGGRLSWLARSTSCAVQVEAKWALLEGFRLLPDVALRGAYTRALGQRDLNLDAMEYGLLISKRFGLGALGGLTPYLGARLTQLRASSEVLRFGPDALAGGAPAPADPAAVAAGSGAFPVLDAWLYRTTGGLRFTSAALTLAGEVTWYGGGTLGSAGAGEDGYPPTWVPASAAVGLAAGLAF